MNESASIDRGAFVGRAWFTFVLSLLAAAVAGYLAWVALKHHGLPVGCGDEGGCAEVLSSRWSSVLGLPVSVLALVLYVAVAIALANRRAAWSTPFLRYAALTIVGAALWFVGLQAFWLGVFCPWCLAEHALGLGVAAGVWWTLRSVPLNAGSLMPPLGLSVVSLLLLVIAQSLGPAPTTTQRLDDAAIAGDAQDDTTGHLSLLNGQLVVNPAQLPRVGSSDAPHLLLIMFDYCCPHCRRTHEYLLDFQANHPGQVMLLCLPAPRDADCNPSILETETRFEDSCELAELALAVWQANPDAFADYDRWLFETNPAPTADQAKQEAVQRVGESELMAALNEPGHRAQIRRNVDAFNASQVGYLPVLMSPGMNTIVGRPESREALFEVLERELLSLPSESK